MLQFSVRNTLKIMDYISNFYGGKIMNDLLYRLIPMILTMGISQILYLKIDKKYRVTNKLSLKLHINQKWKACFCGCCSMISILVIGILGIYVIDIPSIVYTILCGIIIGVSTCMVTALNPTNK